MFYQNQKSHCQFCLQMCELFTCSALVRAALVPGARAPRALSPRSARIGSVGKSLSGCVSPSPGLRVKMGGGGGVGVSQVTA